MKVRDVMTTDVETAVADSSLTGAARLMRRSAIGFLPVVRDGAVIGVVTDRDIVVRGIAEGRNPLTTKVCNVMTSAWLWCYADDVLTEAARMMEVNRVRRLVVLDVNKRMVGLLSLDDLAAKMSSDRLLGTVLRNVTAAA